VPGMSFAHLFLISRRSLAQLRGFPMALRSSWQGFLRLKLLSIPVKAYSANVSGGGKISFHMIHKECHSRIHYKKTCPIHGEVPNEEIVPGYEYAKGEYVLLDPQDLKALRPDADKAISIDTFIKPKDLDPLYYTERSYYLAPDGKVGEKPYAVLHKVMEEEDRQAIAMMVFTGREEPVLIRPLGKLLTATVLSYHTQIKKPAAFADQVGEVEISKEEEQLARMLVEASTAKHFDFAKYEDQYTNEVQKLIEAKAAGRVIQPAEAAEAPAIINLMDALRQSLGQTEAAGKRKAPKAKEPAAASRGRGKRKTA
jgi:DNA end-binding protein Ku